MKAKKIVPNPAVPRHVALIPDGNRRWARENSLKVFNGYEAGIKKFIDFSIWLKSLGSDTLTVWALSIDNVAGREARELKALYDLYVRAAHDPEILRKLDENGSRVRVIGDTALLPPRVRDALRSVEARTRSYKSFTINLLIAYGGRYDLTVAMRHILSRGAAPTEALVRKSLLTSSVPDVDMIIRTSGEQRLSGFLPWQSTYSELYFSKKYWPDFQRKDLERAVNDFSSRHRRFGR